MTSLTRPSASPTAREGSSTKRLCVRFQESKKRPCSSSLSTRISSLLIRFLRAANSASALLWSPYSSRACSYSGPKSLRSACERRRRIRKNAAATIAAATSTITIIVVVFTSISLLPENVSSLSFLIRLKATKRFYFAAAAFLNEKATPVFLVPMTSAVYVASRNTLLAQFGTVGWDYAFAASHAARPAALLSAFACTEEKSPRSAFNAYLSASISRRVRTPLRRKTGTGGHRLAPHVERETEVQGMELLKTSCSPASRGSCP